METDRATPVLLRRIAHLEAMVDRLNEDLSSLRSAVSQQGLRVPQLSRRRAAVSEAAFGSGDVRAKAAPADIGGLAGALLRGEAARVQWVKDERVAPAERLAQAWGLTRQALAAAVDRGEIFCVKVGNRLYYPQAFLALDRGTVATICRALGSLSSDEKLMFWLREHGALAGNRVDAAMESGVALAKVERLAAAWARERGAARVAAAA